MASRCRTSFTEEQKVILCNAYDNGMTGTGAEFMELISAVAKEINQPDSVIKVNNVKIILLIP